MLSDLRAITSFTKANISNKRALTRPFRIMLYSALALQALAGVSSLFPWLAIARLVDADPAAYPFWLGVAAGGLALWLFAQTLALHLTHLLDARLCHRLRSQLAAKLAGLPEKVVQRAKVILKELEDENGVQYVAARKETDQVSLDAMSEGEVLDAIRRCQPDTLTPIEAMSLLYELKQKLSR